MFPNAYLVQPSHTFRYEAAKNFEFRFQRGEGYPGWFIRNLKTAVDSLDSSILSEVLIEALRRNSRLRSDYRLTGSNPKTSLGPAAGAHLKQPSQSVAALEPVLSLSKDFTPHQGPRRQVHVAGVAETWDSTMPVKFDSISTEPNPFISKQKQNHTGFAWYFPPNAHNTDRAFLRRLHSSGGEIGPSNDWVSSPRLHS